MLRAFLSAISGLKGHQLRMDVIGNNIANVNTVGFKASRVMFDQGFAQLLARASGPDRGREGTNPEQVGTGVARGRVESLFGQGSLQATGNPLDLAIQGNGFFVLRDGDRTVYSRAGNFRIGPSGQLMLGGTDFVLQGYAADSQGNLTGSVNDLTLQLDQRAPAHATTEVELAGNLDADAEAGTTYETNVTVYDKSGRSYGLTFTFTKQENGGWTWKAASDDAEIPSGGEGTVTFDEEGHLSAFTYAGGASGLTVAPPEGASFVITLTPPDSEASKFTSTAGASTLSVAGQDGYQAADLVNVSIGPDGVIQGIYGNGVTITMGKIALASFRNPAGLVQADGNVYLDSANSGEPSIGFGGGAGTSTILSGALESSNVDITEQFTDMIVTQRGFQANARMVSTADAMVAELIQLMR